MSEEENQMAQGQDKKGMFSGYLKFERPLSCETETHTHTHTQQDTKVISSQQRDLAAFKLRLTYSFSSYPPLPWPDANHL